MDRREDILVEMEDIKTLKLNPFYLFVLFPPSELQPNPLLLASRGRVDMASVVKL